MTTMLESEATTATEIREERNLAAFYRYNSRDDIVQELGPEPVGGWYLIRCQAGRDLAALKWLSARRFGVFLPMQGLKRILPGWLCARVFDIDAMQARILDCPGVAGVLRCHKKLPLRIDLAFIQTLAREAWIGKPLPPPRKKLKQRLSRRNRKAIRKAKRASKRSRLARHLDVVSQISAFHTNQ